MQYHRSTHAGSSSGVVVQALKDVYARECLKVGARHHHHHTEGNARTQPLVVDASEHMLATALPERSQISQMAHTYLEARIQRVDQLQRRASSMNASLTASESALAAALEERKRVGEQFSSRSKASMAEGRSLGSSWKSGVSVQQDLDCNSSAEGKLPVADAGQDSFSAAGVSILQGSEGCADRATGRGDDARDDGLPAEFRPMPAFQSVPVVRSRMIA